MRVFENYTDLESALALAPLMPGAFRFAPAFAPAGFRCAQCDESKPFPIGDSCSTGYGLNNQNEMICFACCGANDEKEMRETGRACLYLSTPHGAAPYVSNWPGTYKARAYVSKGRHNIARWRYDAYFTGPDGLKWHGVTYGDNTQICHCKRLKKQA